jgi:hypothetical protein
MDNPSQESTPLDINSAAAEFASLLGGEDPPKEQDQPALEASPAEEVQPTEIEAAEPEMVEVDIDGYKVQVPKDKAAKLESERLMQSDYTKKTMAAAEQRKAAEAEIQRASQERHQYAQNLQRMQVQLEASLQEHSQIDWQRLIDENPQEALRQQHLIRTRQAQLQQTYAEQHHIASIMQAEQAQRLHSHLSQQQDELLAKLPEWKDEAKAKADKQALFDYLVQQGYDAQAVSSVNDAKAVVLARKAMLYDQIMSKANVAAKKVATLPSKVEQPGSGANPGLDRRASAYQKLSKSGRVEDAAAVFASIL